MRRTWLLLPLALTACGGETSDGEAQVGRSLEALAEAGPWHIPPETLAIGDSMYIPYVAAGPWVGESGCYGGITPGTNLFRDYLYAYFPQTYSIGGYSCRHINGNPNEMSVHATGRALDVMIHTVDGSEADNDLGDPIGNWLIENADAIGVSLIIWDRYSWGAHRDVGAKGRDYTGAHPHNDHLHVELSVDVADNDALWFLDTVDPPAIEGCDPIPKEGAIIEETDACFRAFGPNQYWRVVDDAGSGGSLLWTNAFESDEPSNWARWNLPMAETGSYDVEVFVDPAWGVLRETQYLVSHAGGEDLVMVDQSAQQGWVSLGEYELAADGDNWVDVYDNSLGPVEDEQHIAVDAVRVTGQGFDPPKPKPDPKAPQTEDPSEPSVRKERSADDSGCSISSTVMSGAPTRSAGWRWLLVAAGLAGLARRRRR